MFFCCVVGLMSGDGLLLLFLLYIVLVLGVVVGLCVFEWCYLDLVCDSGCSGEGFGVCLIFEGEEVGVLVILVVFGV